MGFVKFKNSLCLNRHCEAAMSCVLCRFGGCCFPCATRRRPWGCSQLIEMLVASKLEGKQGFPELNAVGRRDVAACVSQHEATLLAAPDVTLSASSCVSLINRLILLRQPIKSMPCTGKRSSGLDGVWLRKAKRRCFQCIGADVKCEQVSRHAGGSDGI